MEGIIIIIWIGIAILVATLGEERKIGFGTTLLVSLILSPIIGLVIALASEKKPKDNHKFNGHLELAKKAEYKEEFSNAVNHYLDALFHLENDYKNLTKKDDERRVKLIEDLKQKVEDLKA